MLAGQLGIWTTDTKANTSNVIPIYPGQLISVMDLRYKFSFVE